MIVEGAENNRKTSSTLTEKGMPPAPPRRPSPTSRRATARTSRPVLASGCAIGETIATGVGRFIASVDDLASLQPGEVLMAEFTTPEWEGAMAIAAAIVTNQGGRTSHAATVARRLGLPAVVGAVDGASRLWTGAMLTVSCAGGGVGRVYEGEFAR